MNTQQQDQTVDQTAFQLNLSRVTVYKLIHDGKLHAYKAGKCTRVTQDSIEALRNGGMK